MDTWISKNNNKKNLISLNVRINRMVDPNINLKSNIHFYNTFTTTTYLLSINFVALIIPFHYNAIIIFRTSYLKLYLFIKQVAL